MAQLSPTAKIALGVSAGYMLGRMKKLRLAITVGSMLAGFIKLRDKLFELDDLRAFVVTNGVQPLVGATSGLVVLLIVESGIIEVGGGNAAQSPGRTLLAFAAGFSEPFFLGLVQDVTHDKSSDASAPGSI